MQIAVTVMSKKATSSVLIWWPWLLAWLSPPDWDSFLSDLDLGLGGWRFGAMKSWELAFE